MNRSFRAEDSRMQASIQRIQQGMRNQNAMKDKEEELALFLELKKREKERNNQLLIHNSEEFDAPLESKPGNSPIFKIVPSAPARKTSTDDFLNSDNDKDDYDWLMTPPGTPLFPSLEMESQKTVMSQMGTPNVRPAAPKSRLANPQSEPPRSNLSSRQPTLSTGLNTSSIGIHRPSSSGGRSTASRPGTPTGRPTLSSIPKQPSRPSRPSTPTSRAALPSSKTTAPPSRSTARSSTPTSRTATPSARSSTPTARSSTPSARSSTPTARSSTPSAVSSAPSARSSTPSARSSTPSARPAATSARSSTPTRPTVPASKTTSRTSTPTRRPSTPSNAPSVSGLTRSSSAIKSGPTITRNPVPSSGSAPVMKSRPWKPSEMPGYSHDAPPNLRTSMPARPVSAFRGRPGGPSAGPATDIGSNGRPRRQSCSPSRGRAPNGSVHSNRSSVPASSRAYANGNDHVNPVLMGTQMVERVVNMRKLNPPKQDDPRSAHNNSGKSSSSLDSSGFGRSLSKKSLDMAMRHMDIRQRVPGSLRPLMTNIPASSMYSVRSGPARSRTVSVSVSDSPLATSSNCSSEQSINNTTSIMDICDMEDDGLSIDRGGRSSPISHLAGE
ncbi:hypothetical protein MKW94_011039 [Papaver nudicaule]|uniref:Uncharacterized protein n=1 Tax=Papaver nudicaule TaxID=74823 RepID=A0AA41V5I6_PAPNU|nr:hypothetical protein [Papaver nudicaule]